jgi:hypothetical protein
MSKISNHIRELGVVGRKFEPFKLQYTEAKLEQSKCNVDYAQEISIGCKLGANVQISELELTQNPLAVNYAIEQVKRAVIEEIFGEFRQPLIDIGIAAYERDFIKVTKLVTKIENEMFRT